MAERSSSHDETNLLFHAPFDEALDATCARGQAGPSVSEGILLVDGKIGRGAGVGGGVKLGYKTAGNIDSRVGSVLFWARPQWPDGDQRSPEARIGLFDCGNEEGDGGDVCLAYLPAASALSITFDAIDRDEGVQDDVPPWPTGQWRHVALTWHCKRGIILYCDGVEVLRRNRHWTPWTVGPQFAVGADWRFDCPFTGVVDELFIYNRMLGPEDVANHVNWSGGQPPSVAYEKPYDLEPPSSWIRRGQLEPNFLDYPQATPLGPRPTITDVEHTTICRNEAEYISHPRQFPFRYFGDGEMMVGYHRTACDYEELLSTHHSQGRLCHATEMLRRSTDGGKTWPDEDEVAVFDTTMPRDEMRQFVYGEGRPREQYDMFSPDSVFFFVKACLAPTGRGMPICCGLRSPDRGRTWEKTPTVVEHSFGARTWAHVPGGGVVRMPDGKTLITSVTLQYPHGRAVYSSCDNGLSWQFLGCPAHDRSERGWFTYGSPLLVGPDELHFYCLHMAWKGQATRGRENTVVMSVSRDAGRTWSDPVPIVGQGTSCWDESLARRGGSGELGEYLVCSQPYRSPWSVLLNDGRILVLFGRRREPTGIGAVLSEDRGKTWSEEFIIRDDASSSDVSYPVGCQFEDGRIFTAYYHTDADGNKFGGARHIAGTTFRIA